MIIKKGTTNLKIIISDHYLRFKKLRCDYSQGIRTFMKTENRQLPPVPLLLSFVLRKKGNKGHAMQWVVLSFSSKHKLVWVRNFTNLKEK
jgi:hypothetical protein